MKLELGYPTREAERQILQQNGRLEVLSAILDAKEILAIQEAVRQVHAAEPILSYIVDIAQETRKLAHGLSPRASLGLLHASQAIAWLDGRNYVSPEDLQTVAIPVMAHRLVSGDELNSKLGQERARDVLSKIKVP